jgi:UDP-N-acetylmuramate--alanine ligase
MRYDLWHNGQKCATIDLHLLGRHNVLNSLAAIAVAHELGVKPGVIKEVFANYHGVGRRLELKGEVAGVTVIDDYGHHPTEIKTTLSALKEATAGRRLVVAFQPHRYSRTKALLKEFSTAFMAADELYLTDVYSAGEEPIAGVSGELLFKAVQNSGQSHVHYTSNFVELKKQLISDLKPGDIFLTLGAGNLFTVGEALLKEAGRNEG